MANMKNINWNKVITGEIEDLTEVLHCACDIADDLEEALFADDTHQAATKALRLCALVRVLKSHVETNFGYLDELVITDKTE